ncbi:hypothetical protein Vadar_018705 [Vaccinium darrowii]|uniref:Uncharacterized protein n=1 Tax=Vaccinium darrowii TaxID=229202 RepID=A0ACB7XJ64_9ERIC|nr:hypothetical protein Vadar_018705 [Vaccinium darrowii]
MRKHRSASGKSIDGTSSVFLTMPKSNAQSGGSNMYPAPPNVSQQCNNIPSPQPHHGSGFYPLISQQQPPMFHTSLPQSSNRNWNNASSSNRSRGYRNQRGDNACQICNKTNHTAKTCYYRSNLSYQPPTYSSYNNNAPQQRSFYSNTAPQAHMLQTSYPQTSPGLLPLPTPYPPPTNTIAYPSTYSTTNYPSYSPYPQLPSTNTIACPSPYPTTSHSYPTSSPPPSNWYLDSGATNHVTNDFSNLSLQHSTSAPAGVMVGNGQTVPIAHSGQNNQPNSSTWSFSSGALSNSGLF